jgi:hypothetical protein
MRSRNTRNWSSKCITLPSVFSAGILPSQRTSLFLRFFTNNSGWTLPALFATLRDLRDLAFDVSVLPSGYLTTDIFVGGCASTGFESKE